MQTTLIRYTCQVCGGKLVREGASTFRCPHCESLWEKVSIDDYEKVFEKFDTALREQRKEDLAKLARRRYEETRKEYVSNINLESICNQILNLNPDDFYSQFYLATCKEDYSLQNFLSSLDINAHYYDMEQMAEYLIRGLQARWINAVSTLIEKAYKGRDIGKYHIYRTKFEDMAAKVEEGVFEPALPRDIFVAYSSQDIKKVDELLRVLEDENGLTCFVAARNLRHGGGAVENYHKAINTAIRNCKALVFISSANSRSFKCEAMQELIYIKENMPEMWRIELLAEDYKGSRAERFFKEFFAGLEYCTSAEEAADRYFDKSEEELSVFAKNEAYDEEGERRKFEEETRKKLEAEFAAKMKDEEEAHKAKAAPTLEFKTIKYDNGDYYEGTVLNGKRHGKGKYTWANGNVYDGGWVNGNQTGKGKFTWGKGSKWAGDVYEGDWVNGKRNGKGKYTWGKGSKWAGDVYEGDFVDSKHHGKGKYTYANGNVYVGDWVNGNQTGKGKFTSVAGYMFEGDFVNGNFHGKGKFTSSVGDVYEGDFIDSTIRGKGKMTYANGEVYEGDWLNNNRHGKGKTTWPDGEVYEGDYADDKRNGKGKSIYASGNVYVGDYVDDQKHGKGKFTWANGSVYEGDWANGNRHGKGTLIYANGKIQKGTWQNDKFIG